MLTRRQFLIGSGLGLVGAVPLARILLGTSSGGAFAGPAPSSWQIAGADTLQANLAATLASNLIVVTNGGVEQERGYRPASVYNALWTRDHAYVLWHYPTLLGASQRQAFISHTIAKRTTGSESDPDGGTLPANFIADRISSTDVATYKNAGASNYPFMDGIAMVVLALWSDWNLTGDATTFTANKSAIDDCLAAIPRSANGCVYSDPADPSVDYGFTDTIKKTGDCAYGTALQAWAYKMLDDISGGGSSSAESDTYANLRAHAESGLATLRNATTKFYKGSSVNNSAKDDVWATALAVAEELMTGTDRTDSAQAITDAYLDGSTTAQGYVSTITQFGLVRHLPTGQYWAGTSTTADTYQNGGYWATPVWDCVRAVDLVDPATARIWAAEVIDQFNDEHTTEGVWTRVPYEWHRYPGGVGAKGYSASAAVVNRFV